MAMGGHAAEVTLSAPILNAAQRCPRLYALERDYRVPKWRPKALLESCLRDAILSMSSGGSVKAASAEATARYLETAARPGLDTPGDPYTLARDHCAAIETILEAVSRQVLLTIKPGGIIKIPSNGWQLSAFIDEIGILHRWCTVDKWDDDAMYRELHSWAVFGDCAAAQIGMWLHVVEIGQMRRGHQNTPWCRAYRHPAIAGHFRFRKVDGSPLESSWKPVWYQDSDKNDAKTWVDLMESDGVHLIHHLEIREPLPEHVEQFRNEVERESKRIEAIGDWRAEPMYRPACDLPYPCPFSDVCYTPGLVGPESIGFVKRLAAKTGM